MAERLAGGNLAAALLANTAATVAVLQRSENEQVIVFGPADCGETACGHEYSHQAPVINRAESGMTPAAFWAQHRNDADDRAGEPQGISIPAL
jgi:hypothetical protein